MNKVQLIPPNGRASKIAPASTNRMIATVPAPSDTMAAAENRVKVQTFFTESGKTQILYNGDRIWAKVTITLETAGPVSAGEQANLLPVLSGRGQLLQTGVPTVFNIAKGNILYVASSSVNRLGVLIEAYPWLEIITGVVTSMLGVMRAPMAMAGAVTNKLSKL